MAQNNPRKAEPRGNGLIYLVLLDESVRIYWKYFITEKGGWCRRFL